MSWLPNEVAALDFSQARVTQVVQDVKVVPSGAAAHPAAVNETVHKGSAVQTGTQFRSELTFQDQSITRLGEKTIFSVGGGTRSIELGSGQFLLYVPKKAGGAKVKMGLGDCCDYGHNRAGKCQSERNRQFSRCLRELQTSGWTASGSVCEFTQGKKSLTTLLLAD